MSIVRETCLKAKTASETVRMLCTDDKNRILADMAAELRNSADDVISANREDVEGQRKKGVSESIIDRLMLNYSRIEGMADAIEQVIGLDDPVGRVISDTVRPQGFRIRKVSVSFGVIGVVYEARPNVTTDVASLVLKAGSAVILKGSSSAYNSNRALTECLCRALDRNGIDKNAVQLVSDNSHEAVTELCHQRDCVDLIIPRGGASLIRSVVNDSTVPVIETGLGNCHIFIDDSADYIMTERIVLNAKVQRPSVCNACETLLVCRKWAECYMDSLFHALINNGVTVYGCSLMQSRYGVQAAGEKDWAEEYLDLKIAVKIVNNIDEALNHIARYSTKHTETIITGDDGNAEKFLRMVDAAAVNHNVSGRMTDGGVYGFGAEIGISTQKLHARGPMGLDEIVTYKYCVTGSGQIRE